LFYAPLQGIRNFCDYLAAKAAAAGLFSTAGAAATGAAATGAAATGAAATAAGAAVNDAGLHDTIIYFLLD
jgi:hypothetical protein